MQTHMQDFLENGRPVKPERGDVSKRRTVSKRNMRFFELWVSPTGHACRRSRTLTAPAIAASDRLRRDTN